MLEALYGAKQRRFERDRGLERPPAQARGAQRLFWTARSGR
jgi:hypothetical protein